MRIQKTGILLKVILITVVLSSVCILQAHEPTDMTVKYNALTGLIYITVYHKVNSVDVHFIEKLEIYLNRQGIALEDELIVSQKFFKQPVRSEQRAQYILNDLNQGDVLRIKAYCNLFGVLEKKIVISEEVWQQLTEE